jgi:short-subunit dehydrogenase
MRQRRRGLTINLGAMAPAVPTAFHGYLSASKAAVRTFTGALRWEVASSVSPSPRSSRGAMAIFRASRSLHCVSPGRPAATPGRKAAATVYAARQQVGRDPRLVARVIRADAPAGHHAVDTGKARLASLTCRFLPPAAVGSLAARHFRLAGLRS